MEKQFEPRNPVLSCAETEADAGAGQHFVDDDQADALAVGLGGEEGGEEVAGDSTVLWRSSAVEIVE